MCDPTWRYSICPHPTDAGELLLGIGCGGAWTTRDGGRSFETLREGLPQRQAYDLMYRHALDVGADGRTLLMGSTTGGLWASGDGGDGWQTVSLNLPMIHAVRIG